MTFRYSNPIHVRQSFVMGFLALASLTAIGQSVQHLSRTFPGGMPGVPTLSGIELSTNTVTVSWDGPSGYYQLLMQTNLNGTWLPLGKATNAVRQATVGLLHSNAFFRVSGSAPKYAGAQACMECHRGIHASVMDTAHSRAFTSPAFAASGGQNNPSCLPCHTVGYGLPSGFTNITKTPNLAGVQCESCHGPGAVHAANPDDPIYRPRVEIAATLCGGCHTGPHQPTYEEWHGSGHAVVTEDMNPAGRISSCGRCHSGSARESLIKNEPLPVGDANVALGCVTCHDSHQVTANPAQLRYPLASTNDFFLATSDDFQAKYDPTINVCAQCHNHRGATWSSSARAPHHSPQYNMLIGTVGETPSGRVPLSALSHGAMIEGQCVSCHMQKTDFAGEEHPANTGHSFKVETYEACLECHLFPEQLSEIIMDVVSKEMQRLKTSLDRWGTTKAPEALRTKYGARAWEYTTPGSLSSGGPGPSSAEQASIPDEIKKARFNLYLLLHDGSYGIHNPSHSARILDAAQDWVDAELIK